MGPKHVQCHSVPGTDTCIVCAATLSCSPPHGHYGTSIVVLFVPVFVIYLGYCVRRFSIHQSPSEISRCMSLDIYRCPTCRIVMREYTWNFPQPAGSGTKRRNSEPHCQSLGSSVGTPRRCAHCRLVECVVPELFRLPHRASIPHSLFPLSPIRPPSFTNCAIAHLPHRSTKPATR